MQLDWKTAFSIQNFELSKFREKKEKGRKEIIGTVLLKCIVIKSKSRIMI